MFYHDLRRSGGWDWRLPVGAHPAAMARWSMLLLGLVLVGCSVDTDLPPPGAEGPIVVRQWDAQGQRAVVLKSRTLRQAGAFATGLDQDLDLDGVLVRAPLDQGVFIAAAPSARYTPKSRPTAVLPGVGAPADAVVTVSGVWQGSPVIGRATRAVYDEPDRSLTLTDLELCHLGVWSRHDRAVLRTDRGLDLLGARKARRAPLGVVAALAALPDGLDIPELDTRGPTPAP